MFTLKVVFDDTCGLGDALTPRGTGGDIASGRGAYICCSFGAALLNTSEAERFALFLLDFCFPLPLLKPA